MTQKIYKSARGKQIDVGSLRLQNENTRAVGNMGVNARGDRIDANGNVIDSRNEQLQRRMQRQTNVAEGQVHSSTRAQVAADDASRNVATGAAVAAKVAQPAPAPIAPAAAEAATPARKTTPPTGKN